MPKKRKLSFAGESHFAQLVVSSVAVAVRRYDTWNSTVFSKAVVAGGGPISPFAHSRNSEAVIRGRHSVFERGGLQFSGMQPITSGRFREVHLGACQRAVVDFMFAAEAVFRVGR